MQSVHEVLAQVRATSSKNEKLAILTANKDNADLREFLRITYEPRINFYVKAVQPELAPMSMMVLSEQKFTKELVDDIYNKIAKRDLTGNAARRWLATTHGELDKVGQELMTYMIQRDVKAGISQGTINTIWPGLVTDPPYMRCALPKDADLNDWPWARGVYSQIKADGMFANVSVHPGEDKRVTIESRAGSPFPLDYFQDLVYEIQELVPEGYQLHGELLMLDPSGKIMERAEGNGMFNTLLKEGTLESGYRPTYQVWDAIPLEEAKPKNKYKIGYDKRFKQLLSWFKDVDHEYLSPIEYEIVYSLNEAYAHAGRAMARGLEGTVIKHPDAIWEDTTSKFQIKLKLKMECELRVKRLKPADPKSKNAKTFGSMECESEEGLLEVGVTGLKDDVRLDIFKNFDTLYKNGIITVASNGIQEPSEPGGKYSLFLPRFVEHRHDKTQADTLERIREIQKAAIEAVSLSN